MATTSTSPESEGDSEPVRATLVVTPASNTGCPVLRETSDAVDVSQAFSSGTDGCQSCHSEVTVVEGSGSTPKSSFVSAEIDSSCICSTLSEFECVHSIESVRDGSLVISVVIEDRGLLTDMVSALRELDATVRLERLRNVGAIEETRIEIDATAITEKQREAVELAVEFGYYDRPRETDLEELADRLGISRSAVSQRLNAVELTMIRSLVAN